ncbi:hypothetical protein [Desulfitobacterium sp. AusDCA]|uniref:hypothetical protein n=1 Tax=Desulfitobacterium sp. AusDCA TaxID=3240383 RepID=UPI003DA77EC3
MKKKLFIFIGCLLAFLLFVTFLPIFALAGSGPTHLASYGGSDIDGGGAIVGGGAVPPEFLRFHDVNPDVLQTFLESQGSYLSRYAHDFIEAAKDSDINPIVLVSITGQEQSFDPERNSDAAAVARNPFNVYGSWMAYSPGFRKSCEIAARTVATKLSYPLPSGEDPFHWINHNPSGGYAEDPNWWRGVKFWFQTISSRPNIYLVPLEGGE